MPGKIFINYRRGDDPGFSQALFGRLEAAFGADHLFMDIDSIEPGFDFVDVLREQVDNCDILLTVIGPNWLDAEDEAGNRRLDNADDYVRIEIEYAIELGKRIIPVLVNDADMPKPDHLPESLRPLTRRHAVHLTHARFKAEVNDLVSRLVKALQDIDARRQAETTAEAKRRDIEEAERRRLVHALSPEYITKAEELANWDFIKDNSSAREFLDHLTRFPKGSTTRMARAKLEVIVWNGLGESPSLLALENFLSAFPEGRHSAEATELRDCLKAEADALLQEEQPEQEEADAPSEDEEREEQPEHSNGLEAPAWSTPNSAASTKGEASQIVAVFSAALLAVGIFGYVTNPNATFLGIMAAGGVLLLASLLIYSISAGADPSVFQSDEFEVQDEAEIEDAEEGAVQDRDEDESP